MATEQGRGSDSMSIVKSGPGLDPDPDQDAATEEERLEKKESRDGEESR